MVNPVITGGADWKLGYSYTIGERNGYSRAVTLTDSSGNEVVLGGSGTSSNQVQGNSASGAADVGNPVKAAGVYNLTPPTFTTGQRGDLQLDASGNLKVLPQIGSLPLASASAPADASTNSVGGILSRSYNLYFDGTNWNRQRGDVNGTYSVASPGTAAANALTPVVGAGVSSLVVKASAGNFYGGSCTAGATAGFFIAYNAAAAPSAGGALTAANVLGVVAVAANGTGFLGEYTVPDRFGSGVVLLFSTSTTTFTAAANLPLHIRGRAA